jgi:hypothetical protein
MTQLPYYDRPLDSYADHIICHVRQNREGYWRAVLDCGITSSVSDPDFATHGYGATAEEAAERCASAIRQNARGIGKFAPAPVLRDGYDLKFRLMRHWEKKERFETFGRDPNAVVSLALAGAERDQWKLASERWVEWVESTRVIEFEFQLLMAEGFHWIREKDASASDVRESVLEGLRRIFKSDKRAIAGPGDETWGLVEARIDQMLLDHDSSPSFPR